ncbi:hypothetical protein [Metabacillus fastidiosus]|uniref:hypothetical protein n=1 Tax=Metabacillus fastidiosus TaxID=1458 RepID=UPI002E233D58|nr:hypothetical protein [Metabacillus fastidiosus]
MKRKITFCMLLSLTFLLLSACKSENKPEFNRLMYDFKEPTSFPFEVNDVATTIDIAQVDYMHQFVFHYRNKETTQQINYILSKVLEEPKDNEVLKDGKKEYRLNNGVAVFYEEDSTSQSLWWKNEDGFLARYIYYIDGNTRDLGEYKLEIRELVDLANQVQ